MRYVIIDKGEASALGFPMKGRQFREGEVIIGEKEFCDRLGCPYAQAPETASAHGARLLSDSEVKQTLMDGGWQIIMI